MLGPFSVYSDWALFFSFWDSMAQFGSSIVSFEGLSAVGAVVELYVEGGILPFFACRLGFSPTSRTLDHAA